MASSSSRSLSVFLSLVLTTAFVVTLTEGQNTSSCVTELLPCANYINQTTTPPSTCCDPVKKAVSTELSCLCTLYNTPGLLQSVGLNVTQAVGLAQRCGITADFSACNSTTTAESPTGAVPPPPPAVSGSDGGRIAFAWTGFSSLLIILASLLH